MLQVTDRVPTYAGRIQLIVVDEANGIYDMARADEPTVVGTPLNAALFNSIAADLANIAPPILNVAENVANSKNVAFYSSLGATGLESDASVTTDNFISSALPLNSGVFCSVITDDTITLSDLPETQGTLLLMKGESADNRSGLFCPKTGGIYLYTSSKWKQLALLGEGGATVDEVIAELPITVDESGYTDISGLRQATNIAAVRDGQTITITTTVQGDVTSTSVITLDDDGYPVTIVTDGVECAVSWEGF